MSSRKPCVLIMGPIGVRSGIGAVVDTVLSAGEVHDGYRVVCIQTCVYRDGGPIAEVVQFARAFTSLLRRMTIGPRPDLVHLHVSTGPSFYRKAVFMGVSLAFRRPVIVHFHTGRFAEYFLESSSYVRSRLRDWFVTQASCCVVLSEEWETSLKRLLPSAAVVVIANPAPSCAGLTRSGPSTDSGVVTGLFLGFILAAKGVHELLRAVQLVLMRGVPVRIVMAGVGPEEEVIRSQVARLRMESSFQCVGWVGEAEKSRLLADCDFFVLPSYGEGMPMSMLEAMASGLPVIATRVGAVHEVVEDEVSGLIVAPRDVSGLAAAIERLALDAGLRQEMGLAARQTAHSYTPGRIAHRWKHMYTSVLQADALKKRKR